MSRLVLEGTSLTLDDLARVASGATVELAIAGPALEAVARARRLVEAHVDAGDVVYGLTTGFGKLKDVAVGSADLETLQRNLILSHCCGVGEPMPREEVRVAQILRLNGLVRGHSGVRVETVRALARLFEKGFVPVVPQQGSVGASGDLAPLAHMTAAYMGHGEAWVRGERLPAADALREVGEEPLVLAAKEGLALINGTEIMKAIGAVLAARACNLSKAADAVAALSIEALLGSVKPFDERLADLKGSAGHRRVAANVRACLAESDVLRSHADCDRVQDPYSLRCVPQVHGAVKDGVGPRARGARAPSSTAVTDNPLSSSPTDRTR